MKVEQLDLFQNLTEEEVHRSMVCSRSKIEKYGKDSYIFRQEDKPNRLYFVLSGRVALGQVNAAGRQNNIEYLEVGQGFGEVDLFLERESYSYFAEAKTEVEVLSVSRHFFYGTCGNNCMHHQKIIFNMMKIFADAADKNFKKLHLLTSGNLRQRIAAYLIEISGGRSEVRLPMNREDLAAYLNTTRPSLSRELSCMQEQGIIEIRGRSGIRILSFDSLRMP